MPPLFNKPFLQFWFQSNAVFLFCLFPVILMHAVCVSWLDWRPPKKTTTFLASRGLSLTDPCPQYLPRVQVGFVFLREIADPVVRHAYFHSLYSHPIPRPVFQLELYLFYREEGNVSHGYKKLMISVCRRFATEYKKRVSYTVSPRTIYTPMGTDFIASVEENILSCVWLKTMFAAWSYPVNCPW